MNNNYYSKSEIDLKFDKIQSLVGKYARQTRISSSNSSPLNFNFDSLLPDTEGIGVDNKAAGILPYTKIKNEIHVLLGLEKKIKNIYGVIVGVNHMRQKVMLFLRHANSARRL